VNSGLSILEMIEIRNYLMSHGDISVVLGCMKSYHGLPTLQEIVYYNCLSMFGGMHQDAVTTDNKFGRKYRVVVPV
jgi:hypothetical protein